VKGEEKKFYITHDGLYLNDKGGWGTQDAGRVMTSEEVDEFFKKQDIPKEGSSRYKIKET
jgi:hypothetical protein